MSSASSSAASSPQYRSRFGDTTLTKVFVGGLAWETPTEELRRYFEQFGEILEAVIITDKQTGQSKGYGFVTFRDPDSARRSVADPNPVIGGRRANCNIAAFRRPRPSPPRGSNQSASFYQGQQHALGPQYGRVPAQMAPPHPPPVMYPAHFGYLNYPTEYGYQQGLYNPQITPNYYQQMYGPAPSSTIGHPTYHYPQMGFAMPSPRASFLATTPRSPYMQYPTVHIEEPPPSSSQPYISFQPHARQPLDTLDSQAPQQSNSSTGADEESTSA